MTDSVALRRSIPAYLALAFVPLLSVAAFGQKETLHGTVWAFGDNESGQLGTGSNEPCCTPFRALGLEDIKEVSVGWYHSMALKEDGTVWVWGRNARFDAATKSFSSSTVPVRFKGLPKVRAIAAGAHHCVALTQDGRVWEWKAGGSKAVHRDDRSRRPRWSGEPRMVPKLRFIEEIDASLGYSIARRDDGTVWYWGECCGRDLGGSLEDPAMPEKMERLRRVIAVAAGDLTSIALLKDGTVRFWDPTASAPSRRKTGGGALITVGGGDHSDLRQLSLTPRTVKGLTQVRMIAGGSGHFFAVKKDGTLWAWGGNREGQLGDGTTEWHETPVRVRGLSNVAAISCGSDHSLAIDEHGTVWGWGSNSHGQIGDGTRRNIRPEPVAVRGLPGAKAIAAGHWHSVVAVESSPANQAPGQDVF